MTQRSTDDIVIPRLTDERPPPMTPPKSVDAVLAKILSWKRPHLSTAEIQFCEWLNGEISRRAQHAAVTHKDRITGYTQKRDSFGNLIVVLKGKGGRGATTLFSSHVDTVHYDGGKQAIVYDPSFGHIFLDKTDPKMMGTCLGADDGAGVWIMLQMIHAGVPGAYVFHRGEERGCLGSTHMLRDQKVWLEQFEVAVAFDRAGTNEVITHQGGLRCASDKCGEKLASLLNAQGLVYETSKKGVLTDTKKYRSVIAECFNISVGYDQQHSTHEMLDYDHLVDLAAAACALDWDSLPVDRDPKDDPEPTYYGRQYGGYTPRGSYQGQGTFPFDDDDDFDIRRPPTAPPKPAAPAPAPRVEQPKEPAMSTAEEIASLDIDELRTWVEEADTDTVVYSIIDVISEIEALKARLSAYQTFLGLKG